jgi:uncharacterized protein (DUF58 family)
MPTATVHQTTHRLRTAADAAASTLPPLLVAARRIAATVALGSHGRRRAGAGEAFWQFRPYSSDDTPSSIDWRQSAKGDTVFVREREWVAAQTAALWCDVSPSMQYRSSRHLPTKAERAAVLTIALAELLVDGGERIMHLTAAGQPTRATSGRITVARIAEALSTAVVNGTTAPARALPVFAAPLPRHSAVVLVSDFLAPVEDIEASLKALARHGVSAHMLQILDPAEETLPFRGRVRFVGMEQEGAAVVERTESARATYIARLGAHRDALRQMTARAGWSFAVHHTDRPPQVTLAALHQILSGHRR